MLKILIVVPYFAPAWVYGGPPKLMSEAASWEHSDVACTINDTDKQAA